MMKSSRINLLLYSSHALSTWGDSMWAFAVGLFLVELMPGSLRLTASYGFSSGGSILLLGAIIGNWVDRNHRLTVARNSIIFQNLSVCMSAATICIVVRFQTEVRQIWSGWLETILLIAVIMFAVLADVGSIARQICIERDWIVVMCPGEKELTAMSAFLRRIDLISNTLAPVATGQIITYGSTMIGSIFIAAWNIVSLFVEYGLLYCIYKGVPELQNKNFGEEADEESLLYHDANQNYGSIATKRNERVLSQKDAKESLSPPRTDRVGTEVFLRRVSSQHDTEKMKDLALRDIEIVNNKRQEKPWYQPIKTIVRGWKAYAGSEVLLPGLALGSLYMTVLGFDNVTNGFAKEQGMTESIIGVMMAAGALVGIIGTVVYPVCRNKIGLAKTGVLALCIEIGCLIFCGLSIFAPGSPFQPGYLINNRVPEEMTTNASTVATTDHSDESTSSPGFVSGSLVSVIILMTGIVSSRAGLWMADLTVTQLLLEKPRECERGIINGVQNSINKMADILKFLLVILFPLPQTFGYLIFVSIAFIVLALIMYSVYAAKHWGKDVESKRIVVKTTGSQEEPDVQPSNDCTNSDKDDIEVGPRKPPEIIIGDGSSSSHEFSADGNSVA